MSKRQTTLYLEDEIIRTAKLKGINISQFVNNCLRGACEEDLEKKDKHVIKEQISQLEGKLEKLKNVEKGIEQEELRKEVLGLPKESEVIEIED